MKSPYGSTLPASPTAGDHCYLDDGTLHFCFVDGVWTQISGGGGGETFDYGTFCCCRAEMDSWSVGSFHDFVQFYASDIYKQTPNYLDCTWDVLEVAFDGTVHGTWLGQTFASVANIYTFIQANFTESVGSPGTPLYNAILRVYDVVGGSVPPVNKLYGQNAFYSMLRGRKNYRNNAFCVKEPQWGDFSDWFEDLCDQVMGFGAGHTYSANDERALWLSRNEKKRYGLPSPGFSSTIGSMTDRWIWDESVTDFVALPVATTYFNQPSSGRVYVYCKLSTEFINSWEWFEGTLPPASFLGAFGSFNSSWIVLYAMESNANSNHRSLLVKPLGIDKVALNWFDTSLYDLYAEYTRKNTTPLIRHISSYGPNHLESAARDLFWVDITAWRPPNYGQLRPRLSIRAVGMEPYTIRFFLRDKTTHEVSPLSKAKINLTRGHRDAAYKFEIR